MNGNIWIAIGVIAGALSLFAIPYGFLIKKAENSENKKGGDVSIQSNIAAGDGKQEDGGNVLILGGDGNKGASGGNINIGPGIYKAGDGGSKGKGGDIIIKGGDSKE